MDPNRVFALFLLLFGGSFLVLWPVARAFAKRIATRGPAPDAELQGQVDALAQELEHTRHDVAELQERVDFAERLLAKQKDPAQINPPGR